MKISLAQVRSIAGDIPQNITRHKKWIDTAAAHQSDLIVFPELSITNYEPKLAKDLAMQIDDKRLEVFQQLSDLYKMVICIGVPIRSTNGVSISMLIFQAGKERQVYNKKYLHADELPFFVPGENQSITLKPFPEIALAICYEISITAHAAIAGRHNARFYLASVVKFQSGLEKACDRLSSIAQTYQMTALMANAVDTADNGVAAGSSGVWAPDGKIIAQLNPTEEGLLLYDTTTRETQKIIPNDFDLQRT